MIRPPTLKAGEARSKLSQILGFKLLETECGNGHHLVSGHVDVPILFQATQDRLELGGMVRVEPNREGVVQ